MATSLRQYIKTRAANGAVYFLTVTPGPPIVTALTLSSPAPAASFEERPYSAIPDYFTLLDSAGFPWHLRVSALGAMETLDADSGSLQMAGYGVSGLVLRGATWNTLTYVVSTLGILSITNTPAPTNDIVNPDYVNGTSRVAFCRHHNLAYRPDERIVHRSATHCPVDGARLRSWREMVRGQSVGEDGASQDGSGERW